MDEKQVVERFISKVRQIQNNITHAIKWKLYFADLIIFICSILLAYIIRTQNIDFFEKYKQSVIWLLIFTITLKSIAYFLLGLYKRKAQEITTEIARTSVAIFSSSVVILAIMLIILESTSQFEFPRSVPIIALFLELLLSLGTRTGLFVFQNRKGFAQSDNPVEKVLINAGLFIKNHSNIIIFILSAVYGIVYLLFGGVIPISDGFGWDGQYYRNIAKDFSLDLFTSRSLNIYRIQRVFPSGLVSIGLQLLSIPLENDSILNGFRILSLFSLLASVVIYLQISSLLKFSVRWKWIGFLGLFINYAVIKQFFYYPALTDQFAFTLGLLLFYFYIKDNLLGILLTTIVGSFTWPMFIYYGLIFYIFPRQKTVELKRSPRSALVISLIASVILLFDYIWLIFIKNIKMPEGTIQINQQFVVLSIILSTLLIFNAIYILIRKFGLPDLKTIFRLTSIQRILIASVVFFGIRYLTRVFSSDAASNLTITTYIQRIVTASIVRPLIFLLAHVVFYGPIVYLIFFYWKDFSSTFKKFGIGIFIFVGMNLFLSLNSESRTLIAAFPIFAVLIIDALKDAKIGFWFFWKFMLVTFLFSKIWLPLGNVNFEGGYYRLPYQWYFMHYGPWISEQMYIILGLFVIVMGLLVYFSVRNHFENRI